MNPVEAVRQALGLLVPSDSVCELRIPNTPRRTVSGYFNDPDRLAEAALEWDGQAPAVYVTLNPVKSALLARAHNRVKLYADLATSDSDVERRVWFPIDLDPVRPRGISATDAEHEAALERAEAVAAFLTAKGWPAPMIGDSGNGAHLLFAIDLPNDQETDALIQGGLEALAFLFSDDCVELDRSVSNAARVWKLYGTLACKGDSTEQRPHRRSALLRVPKILAPVPFERLEALAATRPAVEEAKGHARSSDAFDLELWMADHGLLSVSSGPWKGGRRYVLSPCPWNPEHTDRAAYIVQLPSGAIAAGCHHNGCQGNGWPELRDLLEPGRRGRRAWTEPRQAGEAGTEEPWPELGELLLPRPAVPRLPARMIPDPLRPWITDVAERVSIPLEFVACPAITALGAIIGRTVGIQPKRRDDWTVVPNVWGADIGPPGVLKSPAINEAMRPLRRLAVRACEEFEQRRKAAESYRTVAKIKIQALQEDAKSRAKRGLSDLELQQVREDLEVLQGELDQIDPVERRYLTQDATVEKLGELLKDNPRGLLVLRDELTGLLRTLEKPGREGDREFYLEAWNGDGTFTYDRIGRGTLHIPALTASIFGGIQPGKLTTYIRGAIAGEHDADGLLQRFQVVVWPDDPGEWLNVDRFPDREARERAFEIFSNLDTLEPMAIGATLEIGSEIPALRFTVEAQELFDEWRDELERWLRAPEAEATPAFTAHLAKYRSLMPALALIFHLVEVCDPRSPLEGGPVPLNAARPAAEWCEFLGLHARKVYAAEIAPDLAAAHKLSERIRKGEITDGMTVREIYRREWSGLSEPATVHAAVDALGHAGWLRRERPAVESGRAPDVIRLHPDLRDRANA
jgi:hypothetical protein